MILPSHLAKLGYYTVYGKLFFHKYDAMKAARCLQDIQYHFNDEIFAKYNWTQDPEPTVTLSELYRRRAQQLRDQFDYLIVMYSGGPDGKNVLDSFVNNDIHIDEIVNINSYQRTHAVDNTVHNADYVYNVVPTLDSLRKRPNFKSKITIIDEIDLITKHLDHVEKQGNINALNVTGGVNMIMVRQVWTRYVAHIWEKIIKGIKVGIIMGSDKPYLTIKNNRYGVYFHDMGSGSGVSFDDTEFRHLDIMQYFYHSADAVPLIIKQGHILKNYMENHPQPNYYRKWQPGERPSHACPSKHGFGDLLYDIFHRLIYPTWQKGFVTKKPANIILRMEDNWWLHTMHKQDRKIHDYGLRQTLRDFSSTYLFDSIKNTGRFSLCHSQVYFLE